MPVDWSMAAVPAAVAIFAAPYITKALYGGATIVLKKKRKIRRLKWEDIPRGKVHECAILGGFYHACHHIEKHQTAKSCWESSSSIATVFNRAWALSEKNPRYTTEVPEILPLGSSFLCTDAETVLAFILCTASDWKDSHWHSASLSFGETRVALKRADDGVVVAHIKGNLRREGRQLTKRELSNILRGWPPWYKEVFNTRNGVDVHFPIETDADIARGGWIVAVGLMDRRQVSQNPLALYRCPDEPANPGFRQNGGMFRRAVARCRDHIKKNIEPRFPGNQYVLDAIKALDYLVSENTGSGMPEGTLGRSPEDATINIPHLRSSDCRFICNNFNEYRGLSALDKTRLETILLSAMAAAVHGAYEVVQYLKDRGMELKIPLDLQPFDREVWLRDCTTRLPIKTS